ncbi:nucleotide exchange factor GrpE [Actinosynnema sp. ALI-1.44]|uniref:nucleotide exchange factor GrpE n=1 Tax=Actinosynnema sp. ALI-1.44 TaxID=1933779 RepID=UPI00097BF929|nr:nucleotide exchange factor GrpE [Actinosynnema sp. ALI-1.44]ONI71030.1 nucleotide exchange factor GrpE [Actinosynnema sp. ALI-1.44]
MTEPADATSEIKRSLDELADLFRRRLLDDRDKRQVITDYAERLQRAEVGAFRQYLQPIAHALALVVDRLDQYDGADPEFAGSVRDELLDILHRHGVRLIPGDGQFNPLHHEAVGTHHDPQRPDRSVVSLLRRGYLHGEWVFRPAQVVVNVLDGTAETGHEQA